MKYNLVEYPYVFSLTIEAETVAEAALLVRLGLNATTHIRSVNVGACADGAVTGWVNFGKQRKPRIYVR